MPRHPPYTLKSLTTFIDHRHPWSLGPSEPLLPQPAGRAGTVAACTSATRSITNQYRQKGARRRPPDGKDLAVRGGDPPLQGRASRRSHRSDSPSVLPPTTCVVNG